MTNTGVSRQIDQGREVMDRAGALARVDGDGELLASLVDIYFTEVGPMLAALRTAVSNRDPEKLEKAAHRLKGSVSIFCAEAVTQAAFEPEKMGRSGDLENVAATFARVEQLVGMLEPALKQLRSEVQPSS